MKKSWLSGLTRSLAGTLSLVLGATLLTTPAYGLSPVKNPPCPYSPSQVSGVKALGFEFDGTGSTHLRVNASDQQPVTTSQDIIGCYATTEVVTRAEDALWQVGVIDRDSIGFFWRNAAGVSWRLSLDTDQRAMTTGSDNPYSQFGKKFNFINLPSDDYGPCKVRNANRIFGAGFTAQPPRYLGKSEVVFKVIVPRFRDEPKPHHPQATIGSLELKKVEDFWNRSSYGRTKLVLEEELNVSIPGQASDYEDGPNAGEAKTNRFMRLAYQEFIRAKPQAKFDGLAIVFPIELDNYHAGYATSLRDLVGDKSLDGIGVSYVGSAPSRWGDPGAPPWKVLAHEIGHNFGIPDYYITNKPGRGFMDWAGMTPGPFDMMAHISARGNELLAWNRWKLGWLNQDEVVCLDGPIGRESVSLTPVASSQAGIKAVIFPIDAYSAMVVESRQAIGSDEALMVDETGLLVYTIDGRIGSGDGPIRIIPRTNQYSGITWSPTLRDVTRHLKAPLMPGDRIQVGDLTLENTGKAGSDKLLVFSGSDTRVAPEVTSGFRSSYLLTQKSLPLQFKTTSDAPIEVTSDTPDICQVVGKRVTLRKAGVCFLYHQQDVNERFFGDLKIISFDVNSPKTITCQKGSTMRKLVGANPKCPAGFRLRR